MSLSVQQASWIKFVAVLYVAIAAHISVTPPQPPPSEREGDKPKDDVVKVDAYRLTRITRRIQWIIYLVQVVAVLAEYFSLNNFPFHLLKALYSPDFITWHQPLDAIMLLLTTLGLVLRVWAYATLGRLFTFQLAIRKDHKLIRHGPYKFLRHPSYTGAFIIVLGTVYFIYEPLMFTTLAHIQPFFKTFGFSSFVNVSLLSGSSFIHAMVWFPFLAVALVMMKARVQQEEKMLKAEFAKDWAEHEQNTWGVVPGLGWLLGI